MMKNGSQKGVGSGEWEVGRRKLLSHPHSPLTTPHSPLSFFCFCCLLLIGVALLSSCAGRNDVRPTATLTVSAAADLTPAFEELGKIFERETGVKATFNFGS